MNLIYQYYKDDPSRATSASGIGYNYQDLGHASISKYASDINCEYKLLDGDVKYSTLYGIFLPFLEGWCHDYDSICFVDSDILSTVNTSNVFDDVIVDGVSVNAMNSGELVKGVPLAPPPLNELGHVNSGVVLFDKGIYDEFATYIADVWDLIEDGDHAYTNNLWRNFKMRRLYYTYDQELINNFIVQGGKYGNLDPKYNWHMNRYVQDMRWDQQFIHYHGKQKADMYKDFKDGRILK